MEYARLVSSGDLNEILMNDSPLYGKLVVTIATGY